MNWLLSTDNRTWSRLSDPGSYIGLPVRVAVAVTLGPDRNWRVTCKLRSTGQSGADIDVARPIGPYWHQPVSDAETGRMLRVRSLPIPYWHQPVSDAETGKLLGDALIATFEREDWLKCKAQFTAFTAEGA